MDEIYDVVSEYLALYGLKVLAAIIILVVGLTFTGIAQTAKEKEPVKVHFIGVCFTTKFISLGAIESVGDFTLKTSTINHKQSTVPSRFNAASKERMNPRNISVKKK